MVGVNFGDGRTAPEDPVISLLGMDMWLPNIPKTGCPETPSLYAGYLVPAVLGSAKKAVESTDPSPEDIQEAGSSRPEASWPEDLGRDQCVC